MPILKNHGVPLLVHAELETSIGEQGLLNDFPNNYPAYLASRPKIWEDNAIKLMIDLCREFDTAVHIVHLSSSNSIEQLENALSLFLVGKSYVSALTLAGAAEEILGMAAKINGVENSLQEL